MLSGSSSVQPLFGAKMGQCYKGCQYLSRTEPWTVNGKTNSADLKLTWEEITVVEHLVAYHVVREPASLHLHSLWQCRATVPMSALARSRDKGSVRPQLVPIHLGFQNVSLTTGIY